MSLIHYQYQLIGKLGYSSSATLDEQLEVLLPLLETQPQLAHELYYWIGRAYKQDEKYEEANEAYLKAVQFSDDKQFLALIYESVALNAYAIETEGDDAYLNYLLKSLEYEPEDENNIFRVGKEYLDRNEYDLAATYLLQLEAINPRNPNVNRYLGKVYEENSKVELALEYYTKALPLAHDYPSIYQGLGRLYFEKNEVPRSRAMFLEANKQCTNAYNYYCIALTYQEEKDEYRALHYFQEALKLDPDYFEAYNNLGKLYYELEGDFKKAKEHLEKAEELATDTHQRQLVYMNLARLYSVIADEDNNAKYNAKLMQELGFPVGFEDEDEGCD
jgi:tetratricopeptide (TPR) repeat protein